MASARALLTWLNDRLDTRMSAITEMSQGWQYCQLLDMMYNKCIPLNKVHFKAKNEEQKLANLKLVLNFLDKHKVAYPSGDIDIQKLAKGQQTHNLAFLNWFKAWSEAEMGEDDLPPYNAAERRERYMTKSTPAKAVATPGSTRAKKRSVSQSPDIANVRRNLLEAAEGPSTRGRKRDASPDTASVRRNLLAAALDDDDDEDEENPAMAFLRSRAANISVATKKRKVGKPVDVNISVTTKTKPEVEESAPVSARGAKDEPGLMRWKEEARKAAEEVKKAKAEAAAMAKQLKEAEAVISSKDEALQAAEEKAKASERQVQNIKESLNKSESEVRVMKDKLTGLQRDIESATKQLREREDRLNRAEEVRRLLHNSLQELKGNIRVFARLRPPLKDESDDVDSTFCFPDDLDFRRIEVTGPIGTSVTGEARQGKQINFEFDRVFDPEATQSQVFEEVSSLVHSALDGYKVCIFAYGQTGSGKTFTMEGHGMGESMGLIPRTVQLLFHRSKDMAALGWTLELHARYIEIYNDKLRDLLGDADDDRKIEVHHSRDGDETHLTNCKMERVTDAASVLEVLNRASSKRTVAATKMNDVSSRSHSIFTLKIVGKNENTAQTMKSEINLIDLAGSERVKDSGVTGERLKEAEHINSSLTHLGNVIQALHASKGKKEKQQAHIFRNSQLTWILRTCLGGDCKTLMMVNLSPAQSSLNETLNSLRFATKVNSCQIGTATRRVK